MSRSTQITCDECGAVKKEANHWWEAHLNPLPIPGEFDVTDGTKKQVFEVRLALYPAGRYNAALVSQANGKVRDLCSEECVHKTVSKYMRGEFKA